MSKEITCEGCGETYREFTCAGCGEVCRTTSTPDEVVAEYEKNLADGVFENKPDEELVSICDDCYEQALAAGAVR